MDFFSHDYGVTSFLFFQGTDCVLVDWQFLCAGSPLFDFGLLAYLSLDPEETDQNLDSMVEAFYSRSGIFSL